MTEQQQQQNNEGWTKKSEAPPLNQQQEPEPTEEGSTALDRLYCRICAGSEWKDVRGLEAVAPRRGLFGIKARILGYREGHTAVIVARCVTCYALNQFAPLSFIAQRTSFGEDSRYVLHTDAVMLERANAH